MTTDPSNESNKDPIDAKYAAKLQKFHDYVDKQWFSDDPRPFIGRVSVRGYGLGISEEDTLAAIQDFFNEYNCSHFIDHASVKTLVRGAREYAERKAKKRRDNRRRERGEET